MAEEVNQPSFNIDDFIIGTDEGSGELNFTPRPKKEEENFLYLI